MKNSSITLAEVYKIMNSKKQLKDNPVLMGVLHDYGIASDKDLQECYKRAVKRVYAE